MVALLATASQSFAKSGTVSFSGEVSAETCTAEVDGATGESKVVTLPRVSLSSLSNANETAADTQFGIKIIAASGNKCDVENTVSGIYFEPSSQFINANGRLNNADASGAKNIELRLLTNNKQPIDLTKNYGAQESSQINQSIFNYYAQYFASSDAATAGSLSSQVDYTIVYK